MILFPPAKINLGLNVLHKREDGYHEIETCMVAIPLTDVLEIIPSDEFKFSQSGLKIDSNDADNLCVKAFHMMKEAYNVPNVHIHLLKIIPMGAGLGGGSADATYVLRGLNELFELSISEDELRNMSAELGSDCPFFVSALPQIAKGRGEELTPFELDLNGYFLKIVNPGIHVGTAEAYSKVTFAEGKGMLIESLTKPMEKWKGSVNNSFEDSIFPKYTRIEDIKKELYDAGALYSAMSGSGSTVFGIFKDEPCTGGDGFVKVMQL